VGVDKVEREGKRGVSGGGSGGKAVRGGGGGRSFDKTTGDGSGRASVLVGSTVTKKEAIGMSVGFVGKRRKEAKKKWKSSCEWHSVRKDAVRVIN
jgi:hypothetical protein